MSAELERSYRRALGWYPRNWREKNADVVAGTLLDVADAEHRTRPSARKLFTDARARIGNVSLVDELIAERRAEAARELADEN